MNSSFFFIQNPFALTYYSALYPCSEAEDVRRLTILAISELTVLSGMQFLLYVTECSETDSYIGSYHLDRIFRLSTILINVLNHFRFYKIADIMRMDTMLVV